MFHGVMPEPGDLASPGAPPGIPLAADFVAGLLLWLQTLAWFAVVGSFRRLYAPFFRNGNRNPVSCGHRQSPVDINSIKCCFEGECIADDDAGEDLSSLKSFRSESKVNTRISMPQASGHRTGIGLLKIRRSAASCLSHEGWVSSVETCYC